MANEFKIKHGFISTGNGSIEGTLDVSTGININGSAVATRTWVTNTGLSGYATEIYVTNQISNLVSSAPNTLDTLNELAAALGDDPNFATTVTNSIATKVPLSGAASISGMKTFTTSLTNNDDWQNSPVSILERGGVGSTQSDNKYAPNLNFHWANRVSNSLWMNSTGILHYGSYSSSGIPSLDGIFKAGILYAGTGEITSAKVGNWNTAYGWGNHASAGYLTSLPSHNHDDRYYTETEINNKFNLYTRYQTGSDFVDGTLVRTSIIANVTNGDSYLLEITGKSYSSANYPFKVILQGYIYNDTFINNSALSYGGDFAPTIKVFEDGGYLCFWWDRISYWNSFSVNVIDASHHDQAAENQVLSIEDAADATYSKQVVVSVRKSLNQSFDGNWTIGNSTWINHDNDTTFNSYNENIRLRNGANGASVIAFGAEGGAGTPEGSIVNYSSRLEIRRASAWKVRFYDTVTNFSTHVDLTGELYTGDKIFLRNVASSGQDGILAFDSDNVSSGSRIFSFTRGGSNELKYHSYGFHRWYSGPASGTGDSTARMTLNSSGNLGIGTTSPTEKLDVRGNLNLTLGSTSTTKLIPINNGGNSLLKFKGGNFFHYVTFETSWNDFEYATLKSSYSGSDTDFFLKKSDSSGNTVGNTKISTGTSYFNGNVGIGTTSPANPLHVSKDAGGNAIAYFQSLNSNGYGVAIRTADTGNDKYVLRLDSNSGSTPVMYASNSGNVGIGTSSPSEKLDVSGTIKGHSINIGSGTLSLPALHFGADTNTGIYRPSGDTLGVSVGGNLRFQVTNDLDEAVKINSVYYPWTLGSYDSSYTSITSLIGGSTFGSLINGPNSGQIVVKINNNDNDDSFSIVSNSTNGGNVNPDRLVFRTKANGNVYLPGAGARLHVGDGSSGGGLRFGDDTDRNAIIYGSSQLQIKTTQSQGITFKTTTSSTERMRITSDGNVGIGTTSPAYSLTAYDTSLTDTFPIVAGSGLNGGEFVGIGLAGYIASNGAVKAGMVLARVGNFGTGDIHFLNNSTEDNSDATLSDSKLVIKENGNVGINTTNPVQPLQVDGNIYSNGGSFYVNNGYGIKAVGDLVFTTYDSSYQERMRINANGNVGIGTTSPLEKLHVSGGRLRVSQSGIAQIRLESTTSGSKEIAFMDSGSVKSYVWSSAHFIGMGKGSSVNSLFVGISGSVEGNVGIGTNSPADKLHVAVSSGNYQIDGDSSGNIYHKSESGEHRFRAEGGTTNAFTIANSRVNTFKTAYFSSNVGIGTTNPIQKLDVSGSARVTGILHTNELRANLDSGNRILLHDGGGNIEFRTQGGQERMTITYGGNVGIGTNTPVAPLQVAPASDYKVVRLGGDTISHYTITGQANHTLTLTCPSYYQAEVVITAHQTNGGAYNNLYIRGIWSNNHHSHHWDVIEQVGELSGSDFSFLNEQNDVENSGKLQIDHIYNDGSFALLTVRVTEYYGTHSYTIA